MQEHQRRGETSGLLKVGFVAVFVAADSGWFLVFSSHLFLCAWTLGLKETC